MSLRPAGATEEETPFQKQQRAGEVGETGLEKKHYRRKRQLFRNDKMRGIHTHTHKDFVHFCLLLCVYALCFVCVLGGFMAHVSKHVCVGQRTALRNQVLSFHVFVGSSN